ncbi:putative DCC family thiol-disulfide oxidoreductase YuxK [Krasilnikovia cinnamomea]|uniref:Putative DCC family thiol-disulfide oxidoreductase YuxK n=1 Tax=Krasilnikovia cinnamomea TaxID=349313 RepID=A0A4Q7ZMY8_9ACTN|nr:DCC1-like thiol-disulfide oxidoreductase family protein [Krasilnikovia cinnamomea]RZU51725.1 putative DCC family thiol-disulfide oxidoreductase YuxK [Krasilnikovia cinnamomea]
MNADRPTFVFDGDCSFCSTCADFIQRRIPTRAAVVPWQFTDLAALGLTRERAEESVQWVGTDGTIAAGPDAIALLLRDAGRLWTLPGRALQTPPVRFAAWPAYRWVAEHRHMLPGGTAACSLPQAQRDALRPPS